MTLGLLWGEGRGGGRVGCEVVDPGCLDLFFTLWAGTVKAAILNWWWKDWCQSAAFLWAFLKRGLCSRRKSPLTHGPIVQYHDFITIKLWLINVIIYFALMTVFFACVYIKTTSLIYCEIMNSFDLWIICCEDKQAFVSWFQWTLSLCKAIAVVGLKVNQLDYRSHKFVLASAMATQVLQLECPLECPFSDVRLSFAQHIDVNALWMRTSKDWDPKLGHNWGVIHPMTAGRGWWGRYWQWMDGQCWALLHWTHNSM